MVKIASPWSYDFGINRISLVKAGSRGLMGGDLLSFTKRAGDSFADQVRNAERRAGEELIHLIALGDTERAGPNRNGDGFKRAVCMDRHPTFVKHAMFYRDHINNNPARSYGRVILSDHDDRTGWINLLVGLNATKEAAERNGGLLADEEMEKLSSGKELAVSMATKVPYDVCSFCDHHAKTRAEYCTEETCKAGGLRDHIGRILEDGHQLHADNPIVKWFDISHVGRGADPIAFTLAHLKQASAQDISGAKLAEDLNVTAPWSVLVGGDPQYGSRVMSHLQKIAEACDTLDSDWYSACRTYGSLPVGTIEMVKKVGADRLLSALSKQSVLLSPAEFAILVSPETARDQNLAIALDKSARASFRNNLNNEEFLEMAGTAPWLQSNEEEPLSVTEWASKVAVSHGIGPRHRQTRLVSSLTIPVPLQEKTANERLGRIAEKHNMHYCLYSAAYAEAHHKDDPGIYRAIAARATF